MDFFEQWTREASGLDDSRLETQNHFAYTDTFSVGQPYYCTIFGGLRLHMATQLVRVGSLDDFSLWALFS